MMFGKIVLTGILLPVFLLSSMITAGASDRAISVTPQKQAVSIDRSKDSVYTAGPWKYVFRITNPGSRSRGAAGELYYNGKPLSQPEKEIDYYETPLGCFYHAGRPAQLWDDRGWMPFPEGSAKPRNPPLPPPGADNDLVLKARTQMRKIVIEQASLGKKCPFLHQMREGFETNHGYVDPWGKKYYLYPDYRSAEGGGMVARLMVQSSGPDRKKDTDDDIKDHSNFITIEEGRLEPIDRQSEMKREGPESK